MTGFVKALSLPFLALCVGGCGLLRTEPVYDTHYYTLTPPSQHSELPLLVNSVENDTPVQSRMLFRMADGEVKIAEYNRWMTSPGELLTDYLLQYFAGDAVAGTGRLDATIYRWDTDMAAGKVTLGVQWRFVDSAGRGSDWRRAEYSSPLGADTTASGVAAAFSQCAAQWCEALQSGNGGVR